MCWKRAIGLILLVLVASGWAQELPDSASASRAKAQPSPFTLSSPQDVGQPRCPKWAGGCWDYSRKTLTMGQTFKSYHWWAPVLAAEAVTWADKVLSQRATDRGCVEANTDLPQMPTMGDRAVVWAKTDLLIDVGTFAVAKLDRRVLNWMLVGVSAARVTKHAQGIYAAVNCP